MFVRFAWEDPDFRSGRWDNNFTLMRWKDPIDCLLSKMFFQLDLPPYRTEDELRSDYFLPSTMGRYGFSLMRCNYMRPWTTAGMTKSIEQF